MDDECQSMACYATEQKCCSQILLELAIRGANFNTANARGLAPLRIISEWIVPPCDGAVWRPEDLWRTVSNNVGADSRAEIEALAVSAAKVVIAFGAHPEDRGPDGKSAIEEAVFRGAVRLEKMLIEWPAVRAAQACAVLYKASSNKRECKRCSGASCLPGTSLRIIGEFLIPRTKTDSVLRSVESLVWAAR